MANARREPNRGEILLLFSDVQVEAAASMPIELAGGPIGTLDLYDRRPRAWDPSEISALQAYAGVVASLLASAAQAQVKGRLAEQLQVALETRVLLEQAKGALMVRHSIDEATAFEWLRLSARSASKPVTAVVQEILAGHWPPMPKLAEASRLTRARQAERRAHHERAIELHEQAAAKHDRLGDHERAQAERDRANHARKRLRQALAEQAEESEPD